MSKNEKRLNEGAAASVKAKRRKRNKQKLDLRVGGSAPPGCEKTVGHFVFVTDSPELFKVSRGPVVVFKELLSRNGPDRQ